MPIPIPRPATDEHLFLWVMHRFAEVFEDHAIIKGGIALRLLDSPRSTTDIDYVFVPYRSKNDVKDQIREVLSELDDAVVQTRMHSKMMRTTIALDQAKIQVEVNVAVECAATAMATGGFARNLGQPSRIVRVMSPDHALAHKIAAWNERRLIRDLFDCYFLSSRLNETPAWDVLDSRLAKVESRLPALRGKRRMSRDELAAALRQAADDLSDSAIDEELAAIMPEAELAGLRLRMVAAIRRLAEQIEA